MILILAVWAILFLPNHAVADLTFSAPSSIAIETGETGILQTSVTSTRKTTVNFSVRGLPSTITATRNPVVCKSSCFSTFNFKVNINAKPGKYSPTLKVTDGKYTMLRTVALTVYVTPSAPPEAPPEGPLEAIPAGERQGFGAQTLGGTGQPIYHVNSLNDSGAESLRDGLSQGNRHIVFNVAGAIKLLSVIRVMGPNVTIDGCSAPSPGISLYNQPLEIRGNNGAHDIIVQCIRSRDSQTDGISITQGAYNVVIDKSSIHNGGDGALDITSWAGAATRDVTIQRTIISQNTKNMLIKYAPVARISIHHNLFEGAIDRNPRIGYNAQSTTPMPPASEITADVRNNLVANWKGGQGMNAECGSKSNIVKNYFTNPNFSLNDQQQAIWIYKDNSPFTNCGRAFAYIDGNQSQGVADIDNSPYILGLTESVPFPAADITEQDACTAAKLILQNAGHPIRDTVDQQTINRVSVSC
jgi:pectate lyase